jgi:hypothetical protein
VAVQFVEWRKFSDSSDEPIFTASLHSEKGENLSSDGRDVFISDVLQPYKMFRAHVL